MSRYDQLAKLASTAREQLAALQGTLEEMDGLRSEVQDWYDAMNENWQQGESGQKAEQVGGLDLDPGSILSEVESALDELDGVL